ncbi:MAG: hypothetical protein AB2L12_10200 [Smithellaceae bacterium]
MNTKLGDEIISNNEVNLYDYWKVFVKRKKTFFCIFLIPLVMVTIISFIIMRNYRAESELSNTIIPVQRIINLIGNIDDAKKVKVFANNSDTIKSVLISISPKSTDKINIIIDAKTADILPQSFKNLFEYISNLPELKQEVAKAQAETDLKTERLLAETDLKIEKLIEARKANRIFLNDLLDMIKRRKTPFVNINPADLIKKDGDIALEIISLQQAKAEVIKKKELNVQINAGILSPPTVTKQPTKSEIKERLIITGIPSLFLGIFIIFSLEYIERMKARENK